MNESSKVVSPRNNSAFKQESIVDKRRVGREMILSPNPRTLALSSGKTTAKAAREESDEVVSLNTRAKRASKTNNT